MYKDTITLFNRKAGNAGDTWYPTVIKNAHLILAKSAILAKYGSDSNDSAALHVQYAVTDEGDKTVGKKRWLPPRQWQDLQDPSQAITFASGTMFDFFWLGDWGSEAPVKDYDYLETGDFYTYMNRTHDYVFAVSSVNGPYGIIPHFEITGK